MSDITMITLAEVAELIRKKEVSPVEVLDACLKRTAEVNPTYNAYITLTEEVARKAAKKAEEEICAGNYKGALHGVPFSLKDLFYTKGIRTTAGSGMMADFVPDYEGTVVKRLYESGAVLTGKVNTEEFALGPTTENSLIGPSRNPWNTAKIVGGSSGGSAVAVATGMDYFSMGSDSGGSVRTPAAMCGVVGFKPSFGMASLYGIIGLAENYDPPGPLTRSVLDAAIVMDHITGFDPLDPCSRRNTDPNPTNYAKQLKGVQDLKGKVIGVPTNYFFDKTDFGVEKVIRKAIEDLEAIGAEIRYIHIPGMEKVTWASTVMMFAEMAFLHKERYAERPQDYAPPVLERVKLGSSFTGVEYIQSCKDKQEIMREWEKALQGIDAVVAPTCPITAFDIGLPNPWYVQTRGQQEQGKVMCTYHNRVANTTWGPALTVPCGFDNGLPVGLLIMGKLNDDANVLKVGYAYEKNYPYTLKQF